MDAVRRKRNALLRWLSRNLNFYRIHLLFFSIVPVIVAAIFWRSQIDSAPIRFIDALFICVSSMTATGLATINLSPLSPWQQVILFFLMCIGHPVTVSWVIVYSRKSYFRRKFGDVILQRMQARAERDNLPLPPELQEAVVARAEGPWRYWVARTFRGKHYGRKASGSSTPTTDSQSGSERRVGHSGLTARMIRRMDKAPQLINPSGWISEGHAAPSGDNQDHDDHPSAAAKPAPKYSPLRRPASLISEAVTTSQMDHHEPCGPHDTHAAADERTQEKSGTGNFPRSPTVEFATPRLTHHARKGSLAGNQATLGSPAEISGLSEPPQSRPGAEQRNVVTRSAVDMPRSNTMLSNRTRGGTTMNWESAPVRHQDRGFGGFPGPIDVVGKVFRRLLPSLEKKVSQAVTIPRTETLISRLGGTEQRAAPAPVRAVPYLKFDTVVGRNSVFLDLTQEKLEELGGVEYRALSALLWIVGMYHILFPLVVFTIIAPYVSQARWRPIFHDQEKYVNPVWFSIFQVVSAYTNTGTSLVDTSMAPFQTAYPMIIFLFIIIIAGNTGYPVVLRFVIWLLTKIVPKQSQINETLHFLLDHPRRCYIYLFPSHQTWFLLTVLVVMILTDWVSFLVLDIGTPEIMAIPIGTRFAVGLLQAAAVRAAGFAAISLNLLAPAVKVLYITMMYVAVYPIALSVRSTNVYEERSLGIFETPDEEDELEPDVSGPRASVWSRYLFMHARRQLSFDIWWLGFALWVVCIIERGNLIDPDKLSWFNIFSVLFELVSAYGTVGLSLGIPDQNYSFSGAMSTLSKLVVIIVMIRGRHRGLPVAIDRAVVLRGYDFPDGMDQDDVPTMSRSETIPEERRRGRTGEPKEVGEVDEKAADWRGAHNDHEMGKMMGNGYAHSTALAAHLMAASKDEVEAVHQSPDRSRLDTVPEATPTTAQTPNLDQDDPVRPRRVFDL